MNESQLKFIKEEIEKIESQGFGEITVRIKNGYIWRILSTNDMLLTTKQKGDYT